jgi:hypothetical protein
MHRKDFIEIPTTNRKVDCNISMTSWEVGRQANSVIVAEAKTTGHLSCAGGPRIHVSAHKFRCSLMRSENTVYSFGWEIKMQTKLKVFTVFIPRSTLQSR